MVFLSWISLFTAVSVVPINFKTPLSPFKKPKYSGINKSKSTRLQNKETRLKTLVYNIDQSTKI